MKKLISLISATTISLTLTACNGDNPKNLTDPIETTMTAGSANPTDSVNKDSSPITTELTVWNMTCQKCVNKITNALSEFDGFIDVDVNLDEEKVTVTHDDELDIDTIKSAIEGEGFNIA